MLFPNVAINFLSRINLLSIKLKININKFFHAVTGLSVLFLQLKQILKKCAVTHYGNSTNAKVGSYRN